MGHAAWEKRSHQIRLRWDASFAGEILRALKELDFGNRIMIFGAAMLLSVLPMVILLSAFAAHRIDIDISRHLGLNGQGARVVSGLFTTSAVSFNLAILVSMVSGLYPAARAARLDPVEALRYE